MLINLTVLLLLLLLSLLLLRLATSCQPLKFLHHRALSHPSVKCDESFLQRLRVVTSLERLVVLDESGKVKSTIGCHFMAPVTIVNSKEALSSLEVQDGIVSVLKQGRQE